MKIKLAALTLTASLLAGAATPALAWGDREQGILTGIVGATIVNEWRNRNNDNRYERRHESRDDDDHGPRRGYYRQSYPGYGVYPAPVAVYPAPAVVYPAPAPQPSVFCQVLPVRDSAGRVVEYRQRCE